MALTYGQGRVDGMNAHVFGTDGIIGVDTTPLRVSSAFFLATGASVTKTGEERVAGTDPGTPHDGGTPDRPRGDLVQFRCTPTFAKDMVEVAALQPVGDPKTIALQDAQVGHDHRSEVMHRMQRLHVACQAENNIPLTGKDGVLRKPRDALDPRRPLLQGDDPDDPAAIMQPVGCQQCENAPCELSLPGRRDGAQP